MLVRSSNGTEETWKHTHFLKLLLFQSVGQNLSHQSSRVVFKRGETGSGDQIQKGMELMEQAEERKKQAEGDRWYVEVELNCCSRKE